MDGAFKVRLGPFFVGAILLIWFRSVVGENKHANRWTFAVVKVYFAKKPEKKKKKTSCFIRAIICQ